MRVGALTAAVAREAPVRQTRNVRLARAALNRRALGTTSPEATLVAAIAGALIVAGHSPRRSIRNELFSRARLDARRRRAASPEATLVPLLARALRAARDGPDLTARDLRFGRALAERSALAAAEPPTRHLSWRTRAAGARFDLAVWADRRKRATSTQNHNSRDQSAGSHQNVPPTESVAPRWVGVIIAVRTSSSRRSPRPRATSQSVPPIAAAPATDVNTIAVFASSRAA